jgi:hypothetical protein
MDMRQKVKQDFQQHAQKQDEAAERALASVASLSVALSPAIQTNLHAVADSAGICFAPSCYSLTDSGLRAISGPMQAATLALDLDADLSGAGVYGADDEALPGSSLEGMVALENTPEIWQDAGASLSQPVEQDGEMSVIGVGGVDALTFIDAPAPVYTSDNVALLAEIPLAVSLPQPESAFVEQLTVEERTEAGGDESQVAQSPLDALRKSLKSVKETRKMFEQLDADTTTAREEMP